MWSSSPRRGVKRSSPERVIDATGDADVAHRAGAPTIKTPPEQMQAASVMFHLAGVDKQAFLEGVRADPQTYADWSAGEWSVQTSGKEDASVLSVPAQAVRAGDPRRRSSRRS